MKAELTHAYLQSIESDPLVGFGIAASERAFVSALKDKGAASASPIPPEVWQARLRSVWARLVEYDRLTAERELTRGAA